jgi:branched-chain amino acid transport system substrate-binding protein
MTLSRRAAIGAGLASAAMSATPLSAQPRNPGQTLRVGLLQDMSGAYRDISGPTSVVCARQCPSGNRSSDLNRL